MDAVTSLRLPSRLHSLAAMALLLERLENQPQGQPEGASPEQYRNVVQRIAALLSTTETDEALQTLLAVTPATAELYENQHYAQAGLCRSPLDEALQAELAASLVLRRLGARQH
jgi:hypothetical protein